MQRQIDARIEEEEREDSENIEESYVGEYIVETLMDPINAGSISSTIKMGAGTVYPGYDYDVTEHIGRDTLNDIEEWYLSYSEKHGEPDEDTIRREVNKHIDLEKKPSPKIESSLDENTVDPYFQSKRAANDRFR